MEGEASVTELAEPFDMSLPGISKHLKVLERAGLIARGRTAQWRPCRLEAGPLKEVADWVEHYRQFWEQSLDRLGDYLRELQTKGPTHDGKTHGRKKRGRGKCGRRGTRRAGADPRARIRRAAKPGLQGLDRSSASGAVVGAKGLRCAVLEGGCPARRPVPLRHALARGRGALGPWGLSRGGGAGAPRLHHGLGASGWQPQA